MVIALKITVAIILGTLGFSALIAWLLNKKFGLDPEGMFYIAEVIQLILLIFLL